MAINPTAGDKAQVGDQDTPTQDASSPEASITPGADPSEDFTVISQSSELPVSPTEAAVQAVVAADPNLENVTLALPKDAIEFLQGEAARRSISAGEVVRIAIGALKYISEQVADGGKLQVKNTRGVFDLSI